MYRIMIIVLSLLVVGQLINGYELIKQSNEDINYKYDLAIQQFENDLHRAELRAGFKHSIR